MNFNEMTEAVREAEQTLNVVDRHAETMARLLIGRLRKVGAAWVLGQLKKELSGFNRHTSSWRSQ